MSKKCIKCGEILPEDASFLPTLYNSSDRKERDKDAKKVEKKA